MNAAAYRYRVEGYSTPDTDRGYDREVYADTLTEARSKARRLLTVEEQRLTESSGRLSYSRVVDTRSGDVMAERYRDADPALVKAARKLTEQATTRGLYTDPRIEGVARIDRVRVALGYPRDGLEARDAYSPEGEDRWVAIPPGAALFNQRGEAIANPLSP